MNYPVDLSEPALSDLLEINDYYLIEVDEYSVAKIIDRLEEAVNSLADLTERGSIPKELRCLGICQYRQLIVKPYRIVYEQLSDKVIVHAVLDGRRDMQTLLTQRFIMPNL